MSSQASLTLFDILTLSKSLDYTIESCCFFLQLKSNLNIYPIIIPTIAGTNVTVSDNNNICA